MLSEFSLQTENCHLLDESPVFALQNYEQKLNSDVIVMGALSRSRLADALIGNTAEKVLDYLDSDVLTSNPNQSPDPFTESLGGLLEGRSDANDRLSLEVLRRPDFGDNKCETKRA